MGLTRPTLSYTEGNDDDDAGDALVAMIHDVEIAFFIDPHR